MLTGVEGQTGDSDAGDFAGLGTGNSGHRHLMSSLCEVGVGGVRGGVSRESEAARVLSGGTDEHLPGRRRGSGGQKESPGSYSTVGTVCFQPSELRAGPPWRRPS